MRLLPALFACMLSVCTFSASAESVGKFHNIQGVVHVQHANGSHGLTFEGNSILEGDTVSTEKDSSVLLAFSDGGQVILRPGSRFQVANYAYAAQDPKQDSMVMRLLKGGLRTVTGAIGKRGNQDAYRLEGATATIGIRGTDFTARLCEEDCAAEERQGRKSLVSSAGQAGRVVLAEGALSATSDRGERRSLGIGNPVFAGDQIEVGATGHAAIALTDGTRIVLERGSRLTLEDYRFNPQALESGYIGVRMLKGAFRVVTGFLAKRRPEAVKFATPVAVIGIRGTAFDVVCTALSSPVAPSAAEECSGGMFLAMRDGKTEIQSGEASLLVSRGETAYLDKPGGRIERLETTPNFIREDANPLPESLPVDLESLVGKPLESVPEGLYAEVNEGRIVLRQGDKEIELGRGESGFAPRRGMPVKLPVIPMFMDADPALAGFSFLPLSCGAP